MANKTTTDHEEIRRWVEERGGWPAEVQGTERGADDTGIIRIDFPGYSGEGKLARVSWDEWFRKFDDSGLAFVYQDTTRGGQRSNFNKLVGRETAAARSRGRSKASRRSLRGRASGAGAGTRGRASARGRTSRAAGTRKGTARTTAKRAGAKRATATRGTRRAPAKASARSAGGRRSSGGRGKGASSRGRGTAARRGGRRTSR